MNLLIIDVLDFNETHFSYVHIFERDFQRSKELSGKFFRIKNLPSKNKSQSLTYLTSSDVEK